MGNRPNMRMLNNIIAGVVSLDRRWPHTQQGNLEEIEDAKPLSLLGYTPLHIRYVPLQDAEAKARGIAI